MSTTIKYTRRQYYRRIGLVLANVAKMMSHRGYYIDSTPPTLSDEEIIYRMDHGKIDSKTFFERIGLSSTTTGVTNSLLDLDYVNDDGHIVLVRWLDDNIVGNIQKESKTKDVAKVLSQVLEEIEDIGRHRINDPAYDHLLANKVGDKSVYASCIIIGGTSFTAREVINEIMRQSITVEYFTQDQLLLDPLTRLDYAPHTLLSIQESRQLMEDLNVNIEQLPKIKNTDAVVRRMGWQEKHCNGQLVRIDQHYPFQNSILTDWTLLRLLIRADFIKKK